MVAIYSGHRDAAGAPAAAMHTAHSAAALKESVQVAVGRTYDSEELQKLDPLQPAEMGTGFKLVDDARGVRGIVPDGSVRPTGVPAPSNPVAELLYTRVFALQRSRAGVNLSGRCAVCIKADDLACCG